MQWGSRWKIAASQEKPEGEEEVSGTEYYKNSKSFEEMKLGNSQALDVAHKGSRIPDQPQTRRQGKRKAVLTACVNSWRRFGPRSGPTMCVQTSLSH